MGMVFGLFDLAWSSTHLLLFFDFVWWVDGSLMTVSSFPIYGTVRHARFITFTCSGFASHCLALAPALHRAALHRMATAPHRTALHCIALHDAFT